MKFRATKILVKAWVATLRNFAPAKIFPSIQYMNTCKRESSSVPSVERINLEWSVIVKALLSYWKSQSSLH